MRSKREVFRNTGQTYFATFQTAGRLPFFRQERWATFLLNTLNRYRREMELHDFVIMPDHVHLLMTPHGSVERTVQLVKGGFSFAAKREFEWKADIWQPGFSDHRIRDYADLERHAQYIRKNVDSLSKAEYRFSGTHGGLALDSVPQWLKPLPQGMGDGGAEAPPLHIRADNGGAEASPLPICAVTASPPAAEILPGKNSNAT